MIDYTTISNRKAKELEWKHMHHLAGYMAKKVTNATCCRCGRTRTLDQLGEVGNEVYMCRGGCNK